MRLELLTQGGGNGIVFDGNDSEPLQLKVTRAWLIAVPRSQQALVGDSFNILGLD